MNYPHQWFLVFFLCPLFLQSQELKPAQLDVGLLEEKLLEVTNAERLEKDLPPLALDKILQLAAKDQARYIKSMRKLTHDQIFTGKKTVQERVSSHDGTFGKLIENLALVKVQGNYEAQARAIFDYWASQSGGSSLNSPVHAFMGAFFVFDPTEQGLYAVQILAGKPFLAFEGVQVVEDGYSLQVSETETCQLVATNPYLSTDLPLHLRLFGSSIYLEYHDKAVLKEMIAESSDGLAIDIIHKDQFGCDREIDLYPSPVHDGFLLEPVFSKALYRNNQHPDTNRLYTYLGKIPASLERKNLQLNVIVIKNNRTCAEVFPVAIPFSDLPLFRINPIWAFGKDETVQPIQVAAVGHTQRSASKAIPSTENLNLQFDKSSINFFPEEWEKVNQFILKHLDQIDSIQVLAYSSIEGSTANNLVLQQERADTIQAALQELGIDSSKIKTQAAENWTLFYRQILGTKWNSLAQVDQATVKQKLQESTFEEAMTPLLAQQREAQVIVHFQQTRNEAFSPYETAVTRKEAKAKLIALQTAINQEKTEKALQLQEELIRLFLDFQVNLSDLVKLNIPITIQNKWLLSNALSLELFFKKNLRTDEAYINRVKEIQALAPLDLSLQFNYLGYAVRYLYEEGAPLEDPESLNAAILQLYDRPEASVQYQDISRTLDRLMVNFHLAAVDYYFHQRRYSDRNASMLAIQDFFSQEDISEAEALALTKFFNRNYYLDWSLETMRPYLDRNDASEDLLFTYFQTYSIWKGGKRDTFYYQLLDQCLNKNRNRLCQWIKTYFQLQRDEKIRKVFCAHC
ncbi:MAG: hypothetical protein KTR30_26680 [Saprospiraceae bacterium]|nr:hypothetical protein [Saprospiraceae bacterium]